MFPYAQLPAAQGMEFSELDLGVLPDGADPSPRCWGSLLTGGHTCCPGFTPGKLHFKNKYCDNCRNCIMVPTAQIRALSTEQAEEATNRRSEGFWNQAPASMGGGLYRIINNTVTCSGPWLALFHGQPPPIHFPDIPENWVQDDGLIRLCVAKGTLVPAKTLRCGQPQSSAKRRKVFEGVDGYPMMVPQEYQPAGFDGNPFRAPLLASGRPSWPCSSSASALPPLQPQPVMPAVPLDHLGGVGGLLNTSAPTCGPFGQPTVMAPCNIPFHVVPSSSSLMPTPLSSSVVAAPASSGGMGWGLGSISSSLQAAVMEAEGHMEAELNHALGVEIMPTQAHAPLLPPATHPPTPTHPHTHTPSHTERAPPSRTRHLSWSPPRRLRRSTRVAAWPARAWGAGALRRALHPHTSQKRCMRPARLSRLLAPAAGRRSSLVTPRNGGGSESGDTSVSDSSAAMWERARAAAAQGEAMMMMSRPSGGLAAAEDARAPWPTPEHSNESLLSNEQSFRSSRLSSRLEVPGSFTSQSTAVTGTGTAHRRDLVPRSRRNPSAPPHRLPLRLTPRAARPLSPTATAASGGAAGRGRWASTSRCLARPTATCVAALPLLSAVPRACASAPERDPPPPRCGR